MADARASMAETQTTENTLTLDMEPEILRSLLDTPSDFHPDPGSSSQPSSLLYRADPELCSLLRALPSKADIVALIGTVEAAHRKEITEVKAEIKVLTSRLTKGESTLTTLEN